MFWVISKKSKLEIPQWINIAPARAYPKLKGKTPPSPQPLLVKFKKKEGEFSGCNANCGKAPRILISQQKAVETTKLPLDF